MQKRILTVDFEKQLDSEKQKLKLVQQKLDEKYSELVDVKTENEQEKAKIISDWTERLNNESEQIERIKSEKKQAARLADKSLKDLKQSHETYR